MTTTDVLAAALSLSIDERVELVRQLLGTLDGPADAGGAEAWRLEIQRRLDALDQGDVEVVDGAETHRRIRASLESARRE